jgi:hypothetical protein
MSKLFGNLAVTLPFHAIATPDKVCYLCSQLNIFKSNQLSKVVNLTAVRNPLASVFKPAKTAKTAKPVSIGTKIKLAKLTSRTRTRKARKRKKTSSTLNHKR